MVEVAIEPLAEDALLLRFGDHIDVVTNARVHAAARALRAAALASLIDIAPAYTTLMVRFDPFASPRGAAQSPDRLAARIRSIIDHAIGDGARFPNATGDTAAGGAVGVASAAEITIPVCYGSGHGPDLEAVAAHAGLAIGEVIARHAAATYTVAMLGFAPGFPYLLGLDPTLNVPRRRDPRHQVPTGSVAIGGAQTGIYPRVLPGGWQLIGQTPLRLFDAGRDRSCLLAPGDRVHFKPIDADAFTRMTEYIA